eukprot:3130127-Rhodomonas_salina.1
MDPKGAGHPPKSNARNRVSSTFCTRNAVSCVWFSRASARPQHRDRNLRNLRTLCARSAVTRHAPPRNETQETAFLVQTVLKLRFLVLDFGGSA